MRLRALRRTAFGLAIHRAARDERTVLALSHAPVRRPHPALPALRAALLEVGPARRRSWRAARTVALESDSDAFGTHDIPDGHANHRHGGRCADPGGNGGAHLFRQCADGRRLFLQRRRRTDDRAGNRSIADLHRTRKDRRRRRRDRGPTARHEIQGGACRRSVARLCLRKLWRQVQAARAWADRRELPRQLTRLQIASRGLRGERDSLPAARQMVREVPCRRNRPFAARRRRMARQLCSVQIRSADLRAGRGDSVRPPRSFDFHGAHGALPGKRGRRISTLSSSPNAGWSPSTPSGRPGIT